MPFPFEVDFDELQSDLDTYVDAVFGCLVSEFLVIPKGKGFVEFPVFEKGYEALKQATSGFRDVTPDTVAPVVFEMPIALIVLRCMLGSPHRNGPTTPAARPTSKLRKVQRAQSTERFAWTPRLRCRRRPA